MTTFLSGMAQSLPCKGRKFLNFHSVGKVQTCSRACPFRIKIARRPFERDAWLHIERFLCFESALGAATGLPLVFLTGGVQAAGGGAAMLNLFFGRPQAVLIMPATVIGSDSVNNSPHEPQNTPGDGRRRGRFPGPSSPPRCVRSCGIPRP